MTLRKMQLKSPESSKYGPVGIFVLIVMFSSALWGCTVNESCGTLSTPVGSVSPQMDTFFRTKFFGPIKCVDAAMERPMAYYSWTARCPETGSRDLEALTAEIHKACIDAHLVWVAGRRLIPDWIGLRSVLMVESFPAVASSVGTICRSGSVEVVLPTERLMDVRATMGEKYVQLRPELVNVLQSPKEWDADIVTILQPATDFLYRANKGAYQDEKQVVEVTIDKERVAKSVAVTSPNGKKMSLDFYQHVGSEGDSESILVVVLRKGEAESAVPLSDDCKKCLKENDVVNEGCVAEERIGFCGSEAPECVREIATARYYCSKQCLL